MAGKEGDDRRRRQRVLALSKRDNDDDAEFIGNHGSGKGMLRRFGLCKSMHKGCHSILRVTSLLCLIVMLTLSRR